MKDPAFLFYPGDWQGGTTTFSRHLKGAYIDVLVALFNNNGKLPIEDIKTVLGSDFGLSWPTLQKKFKFLDGLYFNERLLTEMEKRSNFTLSRRKNAKHMPKHMEDVNEDRNEDVIIKSIYGEFGNVKLFEDEYQKLITSLGEKNTLIIIGELDRYIASKGSDKYANHYAVIQTWARRKVADHAKSLIVKTRTIA